MKKIIILLILHSTCNFSFCQNSEVSYKTTWRVIIERNFETKNKDTLHQIITEWKKSCTSFNQDGLQTQNEFIKESYLLFPKIIEVTYNNFWSKYSREFHSEELYYFLPTSIAIQFSNKVLPKDMLQYQSEFSGIHIDSLVKHPNALVSEMTDSRFFNDFIFLEPNNHTIVLNNFRPYLNDSSITIIYDDKTNFFQREIEWNFSNSYIEKSLLKEGLSLSEIRESHPFSGSKITTEFARRNAHISTYRVNISHSVQNIIFYNNFESAVVELNSNSECCPTYYLIFKKNNGNWTFNRFFSLDDRELICTDFLGACNFRY